MTVKESEPIVKAHLDIAVLTAATALDAHMTKFSGQCCTLGSFASEEFDRLYLLWIQTRWDRGDAWIRNVWSVRP